VWIFSSFTKVEIFKDKSLIADIHRHTETISRYLQTSAIAKAEHTT